MSILHKPLVNPEDLRTPKRIETPDEPYPASEKFLLNQLTELVQQIRGFNMWAGGKRFVVDEYQPKTLAADAETSLLVQPNYEFPEVIETVLVTGPSSNALTPTANAGSVLDPAANAVIASVGTLPAGQYQAYWTVGLEGTVTAADADNMKLVGPGLVQKATYPGVVGEYQQNVVDFTADGTHVVSINAIAAASGASATYNASLSVVPINVQVPFTLQLGDRIWNLVLPPSGFMTLSSLRVSLARTDPRKLTSTFSGEWFLELMGYGDVRERRP